MTPSGFRTTRAHRRAVAAVRAVVVAAGVALVLAVVAPARPPIAGAATVPLPPSPMLPGGTIELIVVGQGGVPATGVDAVVLALTATEATADSFITAWPAGEARPLASSLNPAPGRTVANTVVVKVGGNGKVAFYNNAGAVQLVVDVLGWVAAGKGMRVVSPSRVFDSRAASALGADTTVTMPIAGRAGVPSDAVAAVVNLTATNASRESYVTAWAAGSARPNASNANPLPNRTVANLALVPLGSGGTSQQGAITLYNHSGTVDVIVDVVGWIGPGDQNTNGWVPSTPGRWLDTRDGQGPLGADSVVTVKGPVVDAVLLNVTATDATQESYLTVWPAPSPRPTASVLNPVPAGAVANTVIVASAQRDIAIANHSGRVNVVVDYLGAFDAPSGVHALTPARLLDTRPPPVTHVFPVALSAAPTYVRDHHDYPATDIIAACGSPVLAPVDGTIVHLRRIDRYDAVTDNPAMRGGRSFAIVGDDGIRYYGAHIDTFADGLAVGVRVKAGQQLATVGRTGDASVCHLHFGLSPACPGVEWAVRRGVIWPWPYLDSWRAGGNRSPVAEIVAWQAGHATACADAAALATAPDANDPATP